MTFMVFLAMVFCHLVADYNMQGILAQFKQKAWWERNYPDELYKNDWLISLLEHSFMWSFMTHLPLIWYFWGNQDAFYALEVTIIIQAGMHAFIDHAKANAKAINLCDDQLFHLLQIVCSCTIAIFV